MITETALTTGQLLEGKSEMEKLIRKKDWSQTPLGPMEGWSLSLQHALNICLHSRFPMAICWGPQFIFFYNDAWSPIAGEKHPSILGKTIDQVWPEIWDDIREPMNGVLFEGKSFRFDNIMLPLHRYGYTEECYFDYTLSPVAENETEVGGLFAVVIEITSRIISERRNNIVNKLVKQSSFSRSCSESYDIISTVFENEKRDLPFCLIYTLGKDRNPELQSASGLTVDMAGPVSWPFEEVVLHRTSKHITGIEGLLGFSYSGAWPEPCTEAFIVPFQTPSGENGFMVAGISPRNKFDNAYRDFLELIASHVGAVITNAQMHEERNLFRASIENKIYDRAEELRKVNEELERTNQELASFAYVSSHDLQEPLRKIQAFSRRVIEKENDKLSAAGRDYLQRMDRAAHRMQKLIEDLLAYSRTTTSTKVFQETDMNVLFRNAMTSLLPTIRETGATITCTPLPNIEVIPVQMEQLLRNLLSNSLKFTRSGVPPVVNVRSEITRPDPEVHPRVDTKKDYYCISVTDNGIGFEQCYAARIFDVFQRLHGKSEYSGTGIGLAICKKIAENHGGFVTATGRPGAGATFALYIPVPRQ